ncbi:MAG TPA: N-formylglutamate amidohydrolase [Spirochaetota bacterium]|nr:N-formylglutamate amidohydrolase [Spirochaetota bacterium]HPJ41444.1 N-formylglutamate amidohydrolase [Spirochaetota bacterium]HPR36455.1 N-formylglutamate amidohydrolase [Spirochaetota bacterium]
MTARIPILTVIPHAGLIVPEELSGYEEVTPFNIFFESDSGADALFSGNTDAGSVIKSGISRLFVDMDREFRMLYPSTDDGVIKSKTSMNRTVFRDGCYPDEIAISNILKRYYFPFHEKMRNTIKENEIGFILECHTHTAVGPDNAPDRGRPRPLIITEYTADNNAVITKTASPDMAMDLASIMGRLFSGEGDTVAGDYRVSGNSSGYIMKNYGTKGIPMLRISLSRSLFLNDRFFDLEGLKIDTRRMNRLNEIYTTGLEKFLNKYF